MYSTTIICNNVNDALPKGLAHLQLHGTIAAPRGMRVLESHGPVTTVYLHPTQRVLIDDVRQANHTFHLMESLWMLAGRNDVGFLAYYNQSIEQFSDDGEYFYGAYGRRLRGMDVGTLHNGAQTDQFEAILDTFERDPETRQAVALIWRYEDLLRITKDKPCNNLLYFWARNGALNMTIICRSNDIVWGAYGANAVHFSFMHEYVAARLGMKVGTMFQVSNNYHVYIDREDYSKFTQEWIHKRPHAPYEDGLKVHPLVDDPATFDTELVDFCADITHDQLQLQHRTLESYYEELFSGEQPNTSEYKNSFFMSVAAQMHIVHTAHRLWVREKRPKDMRPIDQLFNNREFNYPESANLDWFVGLYQWLVEKEGPAK